MAGLYEGLAATALALLRAYGTPMTLNKRTPYGAYDTTQGKVIQATERYTVQAAQFDLTEEQRGAATQLHRPRRLLIAAAGLAVAIDSEDTITFGDDTFKIVNPNPIAPAGTVVVYDALVEA